MRVGKFGQPEKSQATPSEKKIKSAFVWAIDEEVNGKVKQTKSEFGESFE